MAERGLTKRGNVWWIDKVVKGIRIHESTGTRDLNQAKRYLANRLTEQYANQVFGDAPEKRFEEAAARYLIEGQQRRSIRREADALAMVMPYIGRRKLSQVHNGTLEPFIKDRLSAGRKPSTIDRDLSPVRRVLTLAARLWRDEAGRPWLRTEPPLIKVPEMQYYVQRPPHVLSWSEQRELFAELSGHLAAMALFKVNTGTREQEVVNLRWEWEVRNYQAFLVPAGFVKNKLDRLIVCNSIAWRVIQSQRHKHATHVFTYEGEPVGRMYNNGWRKARIRAGVPNFRVHDLKHTFGFRLRAAGVDPMDRKDLLGHKNGDISRLYSAPSIERLLDAAEKVVDMREPVLSVVGQTKKSPQNSPQSVAFLSPQSEVSS